MKRFPFAVDRRAPRGEVLVVEGCSHREAEIRCPSDEVGVGVVVQRHRLSQNVRRRVDEDAGA